jgi:DHA1 family tetracycline resistance protein-like MFS transporter
MAEQKNRTSWLQWTEAWYISYGVLGLVVAGIIPILLPIIADLQNGPGHVGLVMALFRFGGLTAPLWGRWADRYRLHRWLLAGGLAVTSVSLFVFAEIDSSSLRLVFAMLMGTGATGAATVANLFIIERHPEEEWDRRVGWLQTFYGGGQIGGLILAAIVTNFHPSYGLLMAALLTGAAILPAWKKTYTPSEWGGEKSLLPYAVHVGEWSWGSPLQNLHMPSIEDLSHLKIVLSSPFILFLMEWILAFFGSFSVFLLYPLLMKQAYDISPTHASLIFAVAVAIRLRLYSLAGRWADRFGPQRMLWAGFLLRLGAFTGLYLLTLTPFAGRIWLASMSLGFLVLSWALVIVSATVLTARLSPVGEGIGMGYFNAATALSAVVGAAVGGWVAERWGYSSTLIVAILGLLLSLLIIGASNNFTKSLSRKPG